MSKTTRRFVILSLVVSPLLGVRVSEAGDLSSWDKVVKPNARFAVLSSFGGEAVLDQETQLVWERAPSTVAVAWPDARLACANRDAGGRLGWRLPTFYELASLVDPAVASNLANPALPPGHPFQGISGSAYWTSTTHALNADFAWHVNFGLRDLSVSAKQSALLFVWCVRGGNSATDAY